MDRNNIRKEIVEVHLISLRARKTAIEAAVEASYNRNNMHMETQLLNYQIAALDLELKEIIKVNREKNSMGVGL